jgi:[acyl-carrier-protein] S-malonyltransferase
VTLGLLCSGQGGQHPNMFRLTEGEVASEPLFAHARGLMGVDPRAFVVTETSDIFGNRYAQLLCVLQALSIAACLQRQFPKRLCIAGYSVGELASWGVAGLITPEQTLSLAWERATLMDEACQSAQGLLAIRGLPRDAVNNLMVDLQADIAISNPSDTFIVGGSSEALEALITAARAAGARQVKKVRVQVASHTHFMCQAANAFLTSLGKASIGDALPMGVRLLSGVDGTAMPSIGEGKSKLAKQIAHPIEWEACLRTCVEAGCTAFLELGPGRALASMAAEIAPDIPARSVDDFQSLDGVSAWLKRVC